MNLKIAQNVIKKYGVVKLLYISKDHMVVYLQARTSLEMDEKLPLFEHLKYQLLVRSENV